MLILAAPIPVIVLWNPDGHGTFASTAKSPAAEFVAVMRIGADCSAKTAVSGIAHEGGGVQVTVEGRTVSFAGDAVSVK